MNLELPVCRWRRQPTADGFHVCVSHRVRCNADGIPDGQCFTCQHRDHPPPELPRQTCRHFQQLLRVAPLRLTNRSDGAAIAARVHRCGVHGECTPITAHTTLPNCLTCADHDADWRRPTAGRVRHLTYFLWAAGPLWRWNVEQLRRRMSLFNGQRLVAAAIGDGSASLDEVREAFAGDDCTIIPFVNDAGRREMVGHMPMLERLACYRGDNDVTFYGHGKGASSHPYGDGVRRWAQAMYELLLDYWPAVQASLVDHAAVGVFRRLLTPVWGSTASWHYSGTFRWLRNRDLYARNWRLEDGMWMGSEMYVGRHFRLDESACLAGEFAYTGAGLYVIDTWDRWAQAAIDDFAAAHAADRLTPSLVTVILTAHSQPELVHDAIRSVQQQTTDAWQLLVVHSGRCGSAELFARYRTDARIQLLSTGETPEESARRCGQGWAINEAWRRARIRGDLVVHLSDDDVYAPSCLASWLRWAAAHPEQYAWYGRADRGRLHQDGSFELLGTLGLRGPGTPANSLRGHVDGLQVCVRRSARCDWPEHRLAAAEADGIWMEALASAHSIEPAEFHVGTHRHTPQSTFTR